MCVYMYVHVCVHVLYISVQAFRVMNFVRHPVVAKASSLFIVCGLADGASQVFFADPLNPERSVRFALSGSLAVVPVLLANTVLPPTSTVQRIALEACVFGPMYLSSLLCWNAALAGKNPLNTVQKRFIPLYWDALRVVPVYNAVVWFAIAPHMRGYALTGCQFFWNIYVAWFVDKS